MTAPPMVFGRYLFKNLVIATIFVAVTLAAVVMLTQSLRFLEMVIEAGASGSVFWMLTTLALPRFFAIILPIALMIAIVFVYHKMTSDSELVVMRATGATPMMLARPALALAGLMAVMLWVTAAWLAPLSYANMEQIRQVVRAQYSTLLFREGVFNAIRPGLTVYVRERGPDGDLRGLVIHDNRKENPAPVTVLAQRGVIVSTGEGGQQVVVYDGTRQDFNAASGILNRLNFERYTIDLPGSAAPARTRWRDANERTFFELFRPDPNNERDMESRDDFMREAHRRIAGPLLAPAYALVALGFLLLGPFGRQGQSWRIAGAVTAVIILQGLYLAAVSVARDSYAGIIMMYGLVFIPAALGLFLLSHHSEALRRKLFRVRKPLTRQSETKGAESL